MTTAAANGTANKENMMTATAQAILDAIATIEATVGKTAEKDKDAQKKLMAQVPGGTNLPGAPSLTDMMKTTLQHPQIQALASHPDFPALAQDSGVQSLVSALTNQVGQILQGIKGSGHNTQTTLGD